MYPQKVQEVIPFSILSVPGGNLSGKRRTFTKLAHKGGSGLDQIQLSSGHASIKTTERYLGVEQDLHDAPCDRLGLRLSAEAPGRS